MEGIVLHTEIIFLLKQCSLLSHIRKRSFGQGNMLTPVCHSVHGGGGELVPRGCLVRGGLVRGRVPGPGRVPGGNPLQTATAVGGTHPTGMHSCYNIFFTLI